MTFPTKLERLLKEATEGPWVLHQQRGGKCGVPGRMFIRNPNNDYLAIAQICQRIERQQNAELIVLLRNHADAILGLVRAAEQMVNGNGSEEVIYEMDKALAELNGAEK